MQKKKKKNFPLDYEEKINRPPPNITQPAPLPISHPFSQPSIKNLEHPQIKKKKKNYLFYFQAGKKKFQKKFELKSEKNNNNNITKPSPQQAKPTTSPLQVARSRQAHGFSTKIYIYIYIYRIRNSTHHVASSLAERSNPNTKANQTQRTPANQTQRCLSTKKKKIPNTQTKTKPSNPRTVTSPSSLLQLTHHLRRRSPGRPSSQIVDRRSENADRSASSPVLGARHSVLLSALFQGISLFFSLTLSQSLSLYLTEI